MMNLLQFEKFVKMMTLVIQVIGRLRRQESPDTAPTLVGEAYPLTADRSNARGASRDVPKRKFRESPISTLSAQSRHRDKKTGVKRLNPYRVQGRAEAHKAIYVLGVPLEFESNREPR